MGSEVGMGWVVDNSRLRQMPQTIEHHGHMEPIPQTFGGRDLIGSHIDLDVPADDIPPRAISGRAQFFWRTT